MVEAAGLSMSVLCISVLSFSCQVFQSRLPLLFFNFFCNNFITPPSINGGGGDILESLGRSVCLSICNSVSVSDRARSVSPEPLNRFFLPNLV